MIPVIAVRVVAQLHQVISDLMCGLPQALLVLPALPAGQARGAENDDQRDGKQGLDKRKAALFFHARSVTRAGNKNDWRK